MISLDQVMLLEEKVERAVERISQLQAENDALRNKCSELTNALSSKTEQLNTFSVDQNQIEEGIKKALDRLNAIENSVLKAAGQSFSNKTTDTVAEPVNQKPVSVVISKEPEQINEPVKADSDYSPFTNKSLEEEQIQNTFGEPEDESEYEEETSEPVFEESAPDFESMEPVPSQTEIDLKNQFSENNEPDYFADVNFDDSDDENNSGDTSFDIF